jgi:hypothetical protein
VSSQTKILDDPRAVNLLLAAYFEQLLKDAILHLKQPKSLHGEDKQACLIAYTMLTKGAQGEFVDVLTDWIAAHFDCSPKDVYQKLLEQVQKKAKPKSRMMAGRKSA